MKIAVYSIAKNEEKHVERYYESCKNADLVLIADTGSTDGTIEKAKSLGIEVHNILVTPWRFDTARNMALNLVPDDVDVCVSLDLDEVLVEGWREKVEQLWTADTTRMSYIWDDGPSTMVINRIHARKGYVWKYPCHEVLRASAGVETEKMAQYSEVLVKHLPDRSKERVQYFELSELGAKEAPEDLWASLIYMRALANKHDWPALFAETQRALLLDPKASAPDEAGIRSYVFRLAGMACVGMEKNDEALELYRKAVEACPARREVWVDVAKMCFNMGKWEDCYEAALQATLRYANQYHFPYDASAWGPVPYDLAAVSCYKLGRYRAAVHMGKLALERSPNDERLKRNVEGYEETLQEAIAAGAA